MTPIYELELQVRPYNVLMREGYEYIEQIEQMTMEQLCNLPYMGIIGAINVLSLVYQWRIER